MRKACRRSDSVRAERQGIVNERDTGARSGGRGLREFGVEPRLPREQVEVLDGAVAQKPERRQCVGEAFVRGDGRVDHTAPSCVDRAECGVWGEPD